MSLGIYCGDEKSKNIRHKDIILKEEKKKISKWTFGHGVSLSLSQISRLSNLEKHYVTILDFL